MKQFMQGFVLILGIITVGLSAFSAPGHGGHHHGTPGHYHGGHPPHYRFPGHGYYRPGYPVYPYPSYGGVSCVAYNEFGYAFQGFGYQQWDASQNAFGMCAMYSRYCQVTNCFYR